MTGKVIMPDEELAVLVVRRVRAACLVDGGSRLTVRTRRPLGTSETHSDRMECTANGWGTFIGIIALTKIAGCSPAARRRSPRRSAP